MKRDKDLLRELLTRFEADDDTFLIFALTDGSDQKEKIEYYHVQLLCDHGLVTQVSASGYRLTSLGHDAAEALSDNTMWQALRTAAPREAYEILKGIASSLAVSALSKLMGWN